MKLLFLLLSMITLALCGCGNQDDGARAKIASLEKRLEALEQKSPEPKSQAPIVSPFVRAEADEPSKPAFLMPVVLNVQGRMTEQNQVWCKWSTIATVANTNSEEARYRLTIKFLDKDGFQIDEANFPCVTGPMQTNHITDMRMIDMPAGRNVKSFKAYAYAPDPF